MFSNKKADARHKIFFIPSETLENALLFFAKWKQPLTVSVVERMNAMFLTLCFAKSNIFRFRALRSSNSSNRGSQRRICTKAVTQSK